MNPKLCVFGGVFIPAIVIGSHYLLDSIKGTADTYNPFGVRGSFVGKMICRSLTDDANTAYHFGSKHETVSPAITEIGEMMQKVNIAAATHTRTTPLTQLEKQAALLKTKHLFQFVFELDPSYYPAYAAYLMFLVDSPSEIESPWGEDACTDHENCSNHNHANHKPSPVDKATLVAQNYLLAIKATNLALKSYNMSDPAQCVSAALTNVALFNLQMSVTNKTDRSRVYQIVSVSTRDAIEALTRADSLIASKEGNWDFGSVKKREDYLESYMFAKKLTLDLEKKYKNFQKLDKNTFFLK